jgi:hypothetical protein
MRTVTSVACALARRNGCLRSRLITNYGVGSYSRRSSEILALETKLQNHHVVESIRTFVQPTIIKWMPIQTIDVRIRCSMISNTKKKRTYSPSYLKLNVGPHHG